MHKGKKVIFVHGYTASSKENWYPNLSKELDKMGVDYSIRDYPGGERPPGNNREKWTRYSEGRVADFFEYDLDLDKIKNRANKFVVVHSKDDGDVPYGEGVDIARGLNAELITLDGRDHMSEPENYIYVLEVLKKVL